MQNKCVAIVGGGASGALVAAHLLRSSDPPHVFVIDPANDLGRGVAYSTTCPAHLLNVPAAHMSAFPDEPDDFVRWLRHEQGATYGPQSFVPRWLYGSYINAILAQAVASARERFVHVKARVTSIRPRNGFVDVTWDNRRVLSAASCVLAVGNAPPAFASGAWEQQAFEKVSPHERVVLIGTGLTAIDAALGLRMSGHRGRITMVSRRGLLPHEHRRTLPDGAGDPNQDFPRSAASIARIMRDHRRNGHWRAALDSMRPMTNEIWKQLPVSERQRFMRHVLPYWNVHRHRMAPEIAQHIGALLAHNILTVVCGSVGGVTTSRRGKFTVCVNQPEGPATLTADRVIDCSGPLKQYRRTGEALYASLFDSGAARTSAVGTGIDTAPDGALIAQNGSISSTIFAIGPPRFGSLIETTAMPEIRVQAWELARRLTDVPALQTA